MGGARRLLGLRREGDGMLLVEGGGGCRFVGGVPKGERGEVVVDEIS